MVEPSSTDIDLFDISKKKKQQPEELDLVYDVDENEAATATKTLQMYDMSPPTQNPLAEATR